MIAFKRVVAVTLLAAFVTLFCAGVVFGQTPQVEADSPAVIRIWGVGTGGTSPMSEILKRLETAYIALHPDVQFIHRFFGNDSALGGLYSGAADLVFMTRKPSYLELDGYQQVIKGETPLEIESIRGGIRAPAAVSPLVLIVNRSNPIKSVSLKELRAVLSTQCSGNPQEGPPLRDEDVAGHRGIRGLHLYGFNSEGEAATAFATALSGSPALWACGCGGAHESANDPRRVTEAVESDPAALGLVALNAITTGTKVLSVEDDSGRLTDPTPESLGAGQYRFGRTVIAVARRNGASNVRVFLDFLLSDKGQAIIGSDPAFVPLTGASLLEARKVLK
jgi:phosphate transport system substrate-binding protein